MRAVRTALAIALTFLPAGSAVGQTADDAPAAPSPAPAPEPAPAAQPAPSDPELSALLADQRDALGRPCSPRATFAAGELRYVACGEAGVWIVRQRAGAPAVTIERRDVEGEALGFFVQDGQLWVQVASLHARPLTRVQAPSADSGGAQPASPPPSAAPVSPPPPPLPAAPARDSERLLRDGAVLQSEGGYVLIDIGSGSGVDDGDRVAFYEPVEERLGDGVISRREELAAVGVVDGVDVHRARVRLGLNERVSKRARARLTGEPLTARSIAPPRPSGLWEVGFMARPFLVLDNLGAGVFADVRAGYRAEYAHYEALILPVAFASAEEGSTTPAAAVVAASYDSRLFEVGIGVGGQTVNDTAFDLEPGTGLTALQRVRLGARDGLHVEGLFYVALFHSEFELSSVRVQGQIPMSRGTWLFATGGGGSLGIGHGELGLRLLLEGNGDRGSFFLSTAIGFVHVFETAPCFEPFFASCGPEISYDGPLVGVGGEWRL